jgi:hypothetical protein
LCVLKRPAGLEIGDDAGGTESMTADFCLEAHSGRSTLLETLALQDIAHGRGMMLIDPHGDLAERVARVKFDRRGLQKCALMQPKQGLSALPYINRRFRPPAARAMRDIPLLKRGKGTIMAP